MCLHRQARLLSRKDGDSNPGYPFGVYTLSRRASSTTRASFLGLIFVIWNTETIGFSFPGAKVVLFFYFSRFPYDFFFPIACVLTYFKGLILALNLIE